MQQPLGDRLDEPEIPPAEGPPAVDTEALPSLEVHNMLEGRALPWAVALLPYFGRILLNTPVNLTISATALLIIVGVVIDTMRQLEAQLMMRNYQSFIK